MGVQQQVEVGLALGGAEVAPGVDEVDVLAVQEFVLFDDAGDLSMKYVDGAE